MNNKSGMYMTSFSASSFQLDEKYKKEGGLKLLFEKYKDNFKKGLVHVMIHNGQHFETICRCYTFEQLLSVTPIAHIAILKVEKGEYVPIVFFKKEYDMLIH
jgi:hypothetical protein